MSQLKPQMIYFGLNVSFVGYLISATMGVWNTINLTLIIVAALILVYYVWESKQEKERAQAIGEQLNMRKNKGRGNKQKNKKGNKGRWRGGWKEVTRRRNGGT